MDHLPQQRGGWFVWSNCFTNNITHNRKGKTMYTDLQMAIASSPLDELGNNIVILPVGYGEGENPVVQFQARATPGIDADTIFDLLKLFLVGMAKGNPDYAHDLVEYVTDTFPEWEANVTLEGE